MDRKAESTPSIDPTGDQQRDALRYPITFLDYLHSRRANFERSSRPRPTHKADIKSLAAALGIAHPTTLATFPTIADIELSILPNRFVLKPCELTSAAGVFIIDRFHDDYYYDWMRRKVFTFQSIKQTIRDAEKLQRRLSGGIIAEDVIQGETHGVPLDYKIYTFHDGPRFVLQIDRNTTPPNFAFFDGEFEPIPPGKIFLSLETVGLGKPIRPQCADAILELASRIVRELATPFASVDTYASKSGPVLGEITHAPGGIYSGKMFVLSDDMDRELGAAWKDAERKLGYETPLIRGSAPQGHRNRPLVDQSIVYQL